MGRQIQTVTAVFEIDEDRREQLIGHLKKLKQLMNDPSYRGSGFKSPIHSLEVRVEDIKDTA